jgi:hypothetical protein
VRTDVHSLTLGNLMGRTTIFSWLNLALDAIHQLSRTKNRSCRLSSLDRKMAASSANNEIIILWVREGVLIVRPLRDGDSLSARDKGC